METTLRRALGVEPLRHAETPQKTKLVGLSRRELRNRAQALGITWEKTWSKKQARIAIRQAMRA